MGKELSIIIVDYKSAKFTGELISDLSKHLAGIRYEIIVIDNNPRGNLNKVIARSRSLANSGQAPQSKFKIIKSKKNLGFGAGNNLGAKAAKGEYLLFLNPDIHIVDNSIERMLDFSVKHAEIGALTCLLYQPDARTLQRHFFGRLQNLSTVLFRRQAGRLPVTHDEFFYCDMVTGAAMMVKREIFQRLGGFDENFFMYIEDEDLCRRLVKADYKNAVLTSARLIHYEGKSSTALQKKKYYYASQDYYWQKHYGSFQTAIMKALRYPYILWQKNIR